VPDAEQSYGVRQPEIGTDETGNDMPTFVVGLPLHPLIVHAVVVLIPLAALGALVIAVWPAARRRLGWLVVACALAATALVPVATYAGEDLQSRLPSTELIRRHADLGEQLLPFAAGFLVVTLAFVWVGTRGSRDSSGDRRPPKVIMVILGVLTVALAAVSVVQVVRIGDSGSRAAWTGIEQLPKRPAG
jgi:hypothetical protein